MLPGFPISSLQDFIFLTQEFRHLSTQRQKRKNLVCQTQDQNKIEFNQRYEAEQILIIFCLKNKNKLLHCKKMHDRYLPPSSSG